MRIKEPFATERESEISDYRKKYFIASEGSATEPKYFEKLNESLIKENVTVINILRDYANQGHSNPTHVIKLLQTFIDNSANEVTVGELKNKLSNWDHENPGKIDLDSTFTKLEEMYKGDNYRIPYKDLDSVFMHLFKNEAYEDMAKNFEEYFEAQDVTYSSDVDSLNMVVDRDKDSFTEEQYDKVVEFCKKNNVNLYVSNPSFELWLYMHFDEFDSENKEDLIKNRKMNSSGRRYIEKRLHDACGYRKNSLNFKEFEPGIKNAIRREKDLAEDIAKIKNELGTNVGLLVNKMIKEK